MQETISSELLAVRDVDATLQFGQCFSSKKWTAVFISIFAMSGVVLFSAVMLCIIDFADKDWIIMMIAGGSLIGVSLLLYLYFHSGKKKVKLWLQDSVILKARTNKVSEAIETRMFMIFAKATAIQIRFTYMRKKLVKSSVQKGKKACLPVYNKYVDKEILIAYSPKYDQVMLIKPKSEQRILAEMSK